jgi:hypothetical protein
MENNSLAETVRDLEARAAEYEQLLQVCILERCNLIVQVGPLTLTTNERNEVVPQLARFPTQFSEEGVRTIKGMTFYNGKDEKVKAEVFGVREWYGKEVKRLMAAISLMRNL